MWKYTVIFLITIFLSIILFLLAKYVNNDIKNDKIVKNKIKQHVPKFMLDLYKQNANGSDFSGPDIVRSVIPKLAECIDNCDNHVLVFDIPATQNDEEFYCGQLKILTIFENDEYIDLERFFKLSIYDDSNNELLLQEKSHSKLRNNSWLTFNLTHSIKKLLKIKNSANLRILIASQSYYKNKNFKFSLMPKEENNLEHDYPILILSYNTIKDKNNIRKRRSPFDEDFEYDMNFVWEDEVQRKKKKRFKNSCSRRALFVDFSEINYDTWIVQPAGYEAFQCLGKCFYPVAEHLNPTKHAVVQALLHSVSPSKVPRSCCVPTKLDPISVLYIDNNGVLTYRYAYRDMVVSECGCR